MKKMGCGRDWYRPAGCHGSICIKWCNSDLCNKELIRHSPFRKELEEEGNSSSGDSGDWLSSLFGGSAMTIVSPGIFFLLTIFNFVLVLLL